MEYILTFLVIYINSIALTIKLKNKIESNIPRTIIGIILIVYIFGLFDKLRYGVISISIFTVFMAIFIIYKIIKNRKEINIKERIITPGLVVYVLLGILYIIFNKGIVFIEYDEFSHWGLIVKNMYEFGDFGTKSIIQYNEYPPFIGIFQYILLFFKKSYSEDTIIIGLNILYLSFIIPLFRNIKWDKSLIKLIILIPTIIIVPIIFYQDFYITLFMDGFLGCTFAYIIYSWYIYEGKEKYISIILGLIAITLIKSIGIYLAIGTSILFIMDSILNKKVNLKYTLKIGILCIMVIAITTVTWRLKIKIDGANEKWNIANINMENIEKVLKGNGEYYQKTTIKNYITELFEAKGGFTTRNMNAVNLLMLLIAFDIVVFKLLKENKKRYVLMSTFMLLFWCIYIAIQLLVYLFIFEPEEAMILACYTRYLSTIPFAIVLINIVFLENVLKDNEIKKSNIILIFSILVIFLSIQDINDIYLKNVQNKQERIDYRNKYKKILEYSDILNKNDKVYYISNFVDEREIIIAKYEFLPLKIGNESSKLTMTKEEFIQTLLQEEYTHVYIEFTDRILNNQYTDLFIDGKIESKTMYEIKKDENKLVLLKVE